MGDRRGGGIDQQNSLAGGEPLIAPITCLPQRAGTDAACFDNGFHKQVAYCAASLPAPKPAITMCDTEQSGNGAIQGDLQEFWHGFAAHVIDRAKHRSEEHTSELQSLMRIPYAVFCLKKKKRQYDKNQRIM